MTTRQLWNRHTALQVGEVYFPSGTLDIEFTVDSGDGGAGTAELSIWNLSSTTRERLATGDIVTLDAGYLQDHGAVFTGTVGSIEDEIDGPDVRTILTCQNRTLPTDLEPKNYSAGVPIQQIVTDTFTAAKIPVGTIDDIGTTAPYEYTSDPAAGKTLAWCVQQCNGNKSIADEKKKPFRHYVEEGKGYFVPADYARPVTEAIVVSSPTGLISVRKADPDDASYDLIVQTLFLWRTRINSVIRLTSRVAGTSGDYRVIGYSHESDEYITELKVKR